MKLKLCAALLLANVITGVSYAKPTPLTWCNYHDRFHLSKRTLASPTLTSVSSEGNIHAVKTSQNTFSIHDAQPDTSQCNYDLTGVATVTYSASPKDYCEISIADGPGMYVAEEKQSKCYGDLVFLGLTFDGKSSYSYSLLFYQKS